jgi:hypothetical protein
MAYRKFNNIKILADMLGEITEIVDVPIFSVVEAQKNHIEYRTA